MDDSGQLRLTLSEALSAVTSVVDVMGFVAVTPCLILESNKTTQSVVGKKCRTCLPADFPAPGLHSPIDSHPGHTLSP